MVAATVSTALFLSLASYARVEMAPGVIMPAAGVPPILPLRPGVIVALPVHDGQEIRAGAVLAEIRTEEDSASGQPVAVRIGRAIAQQEAELPAPKVRASLFLRCPHPRAAAEAYVQVRPRQSAKPTSIAVVIARMVSSVIEGMPRIFSDALPRTSKSGAPIMAPPTPATADLLAPARRSSLWLDSLSLGDFIAPM